MPRDWYQPSCERRQIPRTEDDAEGFGQTSTLGCWSLGWVKLRVIPSALFASRAVPVQSGARVRQGENKVHKNKRIRCVRSTVEK